MELITDKRNELFKRQELTFKLESDKNPSFDETKKKISEDLGKGEDSIDVYNIKGGFGKNDFIIRANVYDSKEDLDSIKKLEVTSKVRKESTKESSEDKAEEVREETASVEETKEESISNKSLENESQAEVSEDIKLDVEETKKEEESKE